MNSRNILSALLFIAGIFILSACGKDDEKIITQVENNITKGTWRVNDFDDSGVNKTANFAGWNFTFSENGVLTATNGATTVTGTWSITDGDENDDILDDLDFNIGFNLGNDFDDLNDDWDIVNQSATELDLTEVGGVTDTDFLTFRKN